MELNYPISNVQKHTVIKTEKYWTTTDQGKLLDILCGNTAFIFGYSCDSIFQKMIETQRTVGFLKGTSDETCEANKQLINQLCTIGNFASVSWAVSGSDGVELAISANDQYWQAIHKHKPTVVVFNPNYHGTTYLAKIFRGQYPTLDRCVSVSTLDELARVLECNDTIGAVLMESCPWIAGVSPWSKTHWQTVRSLCDQYSINFIVDDVFGGCGKLGYVFSHQRYNVQPDIVVLGKSLTAGYSPLSCACINQRITDTVKDTWDYGHTWTPNMAGVGAALAVLNELNTEIIESIESRLDGIGTLFVQAGWIDSYTGIGLLLELKLNKSYPADQLIKHGLNGTITDLNTIRICAPVIADDEYFNYLNQQILSALLDK
jgi:acetylornithine/succinyldiaminopimelate/putrescine aminotransferase